LRLILVGPDYVLGDAIAVFRKPLVVEGGRVRVPLLRPIGRLVAFDRAFMLIYSHI